MLYIGGMVAALAMIGLGGYMVIDEEGKDKDYLMISWYIKKTPLL